MTTEAQTDGVYFNLRNGLMKPRARPGEGFKDENWRGYKMVRIPTSPKSEIQFGKIKDIQGNFLTDTGTQYKADDNGNILVHHVQHMESLATLGYPMYVGDHQGPATEGDLIWPNRIAAILANDPYERVILEAIKRRALR